MRKARVAALPSDLRKRYALPAPHLRFRSGCARQLGGAQRSALHVGRPEAFRTSSGLAAALRPPCWSGF
jgi:hypothetical protein